MPAPEEVVVHPLVLLSVVDHYNRVARDTRKRVVGVLLGEASKGSIQVTNAFGVPFEEDDRDPEIWFLDHSYVESMAGMYRRVAAREKIVGWYSTGPRLREADLQITDLMTEYVDNPILVICEVQPKAMGLPTTAYYARDEVREDGTQKNQKVFVNIPTEVGATEAEEIGVEHLLRDVKDATTSNLATEVARMNTGLHGLHSRLQDIRSYLHAVLSGKLPVNHDIMAGLQDVCNLLPNTDVGELTRAFSVKSNDMMLAIYVASLVRSVLALHNLLNNKEARLHAEHTNGKADAAPTNGKKDAKQPADKVAAADKSAPHSNGDTKQGDDAMQE